MFAAAALAAGQNPAYRAAPAFHLVHQLLGPQGGRGPAQTLPKLTWIWETRRGTRRREVIDGSPRVALETEPPFDQYVFASVVWLGGQRNHCRRSTTAFASVYSRWQYTEHQE